MAPSVPDTSSVRATRILAAQTILRLKRDLQICRSLELGLLF
jgi:hypothetical protein